MEKFTTTETHKKSGFMWKTLLTLALCGALISCWKTTPKDVIKQQKKIENISYQISHYIQARKDLVVKYNKLLTYPQTESNKYDINESLTQMYEVISEYDEKIKNLSKNKLKAIDDLNEDIADLKVSFSPNEPLDPNRWDYLLNQ